MQLKGTDGSGDSVRAKRTTVGYWRELDVPVLVVSYSASSGRQRGRWAHTIGADVTESGANKVTIKMNPATELVDAWTVGLVDDLRLIRELRRGAVPNPLPIELKVDESLRAREVQLRAELLRLSRNGSWAMRAAPSDEHALELEVSEDQVRAALPLLWGSATLHLARGWDDGLPTTDLAELLLLLAAAAIAPVSFEATAALAKSAGTQSASWAVQEVATRVGPALVAQGEVGILFEVLQNLSRVGGPDVTTALESYQLALRDSLREMPSDEFDAFSSNRRGAIVELAQDDAAEAGRQMFNLAGVHRNPRRDHGRAVDLYLEAAELAPRYKTDPLMLSALAGCLWEVGKYQESADTYRVSLTHGAEQQRDVPLLADSLMLAGQYREATEALEGWSPAGEERDRVGVIRSAILRFVSQEVGVNCQDRCSIDLEEHLARVTSVLEAGIDVDGRLMELLRQDDALSPAIWVTRIDPQDLNASFLPSLVVATVLERVTGPWVIALLLGSQAGADPSLLAAICNEARLLCGDDFYDAVVATADAQTEPTLAKALRELVAAAFSTDPVSHGHITRLITREDQADVVLLRDWVGAPGSVAPNWWTG